MTDKQILDTLWNIKRHCSELADDCFDDYDLYMNSCARCIFQSKHPSKRKNVCQITLLIGNMTNEPRLWDMERIGEILEESE